MNRHAIASIVTWAVGSFALVLAVGLPASLNADGPAPTTKPTVAAPTLTVNGVKLQLTLNSTGKLVLTGINSNSTTVTTPYTVKGTSMFAEETDSRVALPSNDFMRSGTITLAPGQTKTVTFDDKIEAGVRVELASGSTSITAFDGGVNVTTVLQPATQPSQGQISISR